MPVRPMSLGRVTVASDEGARLEGEGEDGERTMELDDEDEIFERGLGQMPSLRDLTVRTLPQVPPRGASPVVFNPPCCPL